MVCKKIFKALQYHLRYWWWSQILQYCRLVCNLWSLTSWHLYVIYQDDILANLMPSTSTNFSLETARMKNPRLCFLSDLELIDLFSMSNDRPKWITHVRALFPGVRRLEFEVPASSSEGISNAFDMLLNGGFLSTIITLSHLSYSN